MGPLFGKMLILGKWMFTGLPTSAALDITHRCNLRCVHCYWWGQEHPRELDERAMIFFMERLRARGLRAAILYGGEPTLRPGVCKAAGGIFDAVLAFTNGTNGFPRFRNVQWILSLDGPEHINDAIRGRGVYRHVRDNIFQARRHPLVHMTITRQNVHGLEGFVREMSGLPVKGIGFSFYTPQKGRPDKGLFLPLAERDRVVERLLSLRRRYGLRIGFTRAMAKQLLSSRDFQKWNRNDLCPVRNLVECYKSDGRRKTCTYGDHADCSRCGCAAVAAYRGAFRPFDPWTLMVILGLMVPGLRVPAYKGNRVEGR